METNNLPDPNAIRLAEEKGLVFSEDKKILLKCTDDKITAITIPDGVIEIGRSAFVRCRQLTEVVIPGSVTIIGAGAFRFCRSLSHIVIPDSVTRIDTLAFMATPCEEQVKKNYPHLFRSYPLS